MPSHVLAERKAQRRFVAAEDFALHHLTQRHQRHLIVGHFDAHVAAPRHGRLDANALHRQRQRQVVCQRGDLAHPHAHLPAARFDEARLHAEHGHRRADAGIHHDAGRAEGSQRLLDQAGAFFHELLVDDGRLGRLQDIAHPWQHPDMGRGGALVGLDCHTGGLRLGQLDNWRKFYGGEIIRRPFRFGRPSQLDGRLRPGCLLLQQAPQPGFDPARQRPGPLEHFLQGQVQGHCQGNHQPCDDQDGGTGIPQGCHQSLLEQRADVSAAGSFFSPRNRALNRAVQPVESQQQAHEEQNDSDDTFERWFRQALHIARHQPGAQHDQPDREDVDTPAENGLQGINPVPGQPAVPG